MFRPRFLGVLVSSLLLAAPLPSCDKSGGDTNAPGGGGASDKSGDGAMRYKAAATKLKQTATYEFQMSGGGQFGSAKAQVVASLDLAPEGDKMKVTWKVTGVDSLELKGALQPKAENGRPNPLPDPKAALLEKGNGAFVMDLRGETDEDATKALPENVARKKEREERQKAIEEARKAAKEKADAEKKDGDKKEASGGEDEGEDAGPDVPDDLRSAAAADQFVGVFSGIFSMPALPEAALKEGKPVTVEEEDEVPLGDSGIMLPFESETIYTLVKIDDSSGKRIAEIEVELEGSGATEMQGGMLVVDQSTEATILFNLDDGIPVSVTSTSTQAFSVGENGQEIMTIVQSEFEAG